MSSITADKQRNRKGSIRLWAVIFWLFVWQAVSMGIGQEILLVSPVRVLKRLGELEKDPGRTVSPYYNKNKSGSVLL